MKRTVISLTLAAFAIVVFPLTNASAQDTKTARGTVTALAGDSLTIKAGTGDMKFTVDAKTTVEAPGAGTADRKAEASGKGGPRLAEVIKPGQGVEVTYRESGGTMHATLIRRVNNPSAGGGEAKAATMNSNGTIQSIAGNVVTITGSSAGGGTFKQSFTVDETTKVVGRGVGTATAPQGGKGQLSALLKVGDTVNVSYRETGTTLLASEIRVSK